MADSLNVVKNVLEFIANFSCFYPSAHANGHLRLKVWYDNDRKNMENLLKQQLEKSGFSTKKFSKSPIVVKIMVSFSTKTVV